MPINNPHLIVFIGDGGVGKSTLVVALATLYPAQFCILPCDTTREVRTDSRERMRLDGHIYNFMDAEWLEGSIAQGGHVAVTRRSNGIYAIRKVFVDVRVRDGRHLILHAAPPVLDDLRTLGLPLMVIRIVAQGRAVDDRDADRIARDSAEAHVPHHIDATVTNSFAPGGRDRAVMTIVDLIARFTE